MDKLGGVEKIKYAIGEILSGYAELCIEINGQSIKQFQLNVDAICSLFEPKPDPSRLLSDDAIDNAWPDETPECNTIAETLKQGILIGAKMIAKAQDVKTATMVRAKTIKEVGEWLENGNGKPPPRGSMIYCISELELVTLKKGEVPDKEQNLDELEGGIEP